MKKIANFIVLALSIALILSGCFPKIIFIPDNKTIGEPKTFEKDGIKLLLTDKFVEQESEMGFDAYYVSNFSGVVVMKEAFSLEEGLAERSLEDYITNVIANNGHTNIKPQNRDGLWFYVKETENTICYSFTFKGTDAFWIVQYLCRPSDAPMLEEVFFLWADAVEVS